MMEISNIDIHALSDGAVLKLVGEFIQEHRLSQNKTQQQLAEAAHIHRTTLIQIENGKGGTLLSIIQILRILQQMHVFASFETKQQISPLELAKLEQHKRKRASMGKAEQGNSDSNW